MKKNTTEIKIVLYMGLISALFLTLPINNIIAINEYNHFEDSFPLQTYDSRFYVIHLDDGEEIDISVMAAYKGDFDLFLFSIRPNNTNLGDFGYDPIIFQLASKYDISRDNDSYIHFKAAENTQFGSALYYIQVALYANGTDAFYITINSTSDFALDTYFIPFIPGFQLELIICIPILVIGVIFLKSKQKIKFIK